MDAKPEVEYDIDKHQKIASLMSVDEIHFIDDTERSIRVRYLSILDIALIQVNKWLSLNRC